jgi:hypothetical protein
MTCGAMVTFSALGLATVVGRLIYSPLGFGISSLIDTALVDLSHHQLLKVEKGASAKIYAISLSVSMGKLWRALLVRYHMTIHSNPEIAEAVARWCLDKRESLAAGCMDDGDAIEL